MTKQENSDDRRNRPRTAARGTVPVMVEVQGHGGTLSGTLRDLSRQGVGLYLSVPVQVGAHMQFRTLVGQRVIAATCCVANCRPAGPGQYIVGAAILSADRLAECTPASHEGVDEAQVSDVAQRLGRLIHRPDEDEKGAN